MPTQTFPLFDTAVLPAALESDDPELLQSFYDMFVTHTRDSSQILRNVALPCDFDAIRRAAHSLKSSSRSIGAMKLGELLRDLELAAEEQSAAALFSCLSEIEQVLPETLAVISAEIRRLTSARNL
jgi:HPt (histidine-containing phosphotransfer) domain-containing protein